MGQIMHNGFSFEIVRTYLDKSVVEIKEGGVLHHSYVTDVICGSLKDWVIDNY